MAASAEGPRDPDFMLSLARGLAVLEAVAASNDPMTIADVSRIAGLNRASVRRALHTLEQLGYVTSDPGGFAITMKPLALSQHLLAPTALAHLSQPLLDRLRDDLGESCSLGILEGDHIQYIARAEAYRILSIGLRVGSRLPLYPTSMGRVLLAAMQPDELDGYLRRTSVRALTGKTITDPRQIRKLIRQVSADGFAIVDQELEIGLRSIAAPVTQNGRTVAALNVGTSSARVDLSELRKRFVPVIVAAARDLSKLASGY